MPTAFYKSSTAGNNAWTRVTSEDGLPLTVLADAEVGTYNCVLAEDLVTDVVVSPISTSSAEVKALGTATGSFASSINVAAPATDSGDLIYLLVWANQVTITTPTNFDLVAKSDPNTSGGGNIYVFQWNGGGTRPNSNNTTITASGSQHIRGQFLICTGSETGNSGVKAINNNSGAPHVSAALSVTEGSIVFHMVSVRSDVTPTSITFSGPTPDQTTLSPPDAEGRFEGWQNISCGGWVQVISEAATGSNNQMTITAAFAVVGIISVEVKA
jgi:hypothetical protein